MADILPTPLKVYATNVARAHGAKGAIVLLINEGERPVTFASDGLTGLETKDALLLMASAFPDEKPTFARGGFVDDEGVPA